MIDQFFDISGKNALVTGGTSGIGLAVVTRLVRANARVFVLDLNENDGLDDLDVGFLTSDVRDIDSVRLGFEAAVASMGELDIVINNAGVAPETGRLADTDHEAAKLTLDVNLTGVMNGLICAPHYMCDHGSIINTASASAGRAFPTYGPYAASKAGVVSLTQIAAVELGSRGIRVNAVCPGTIETPMEPADGHEAKVSRVLAPLGRIGSTDDLTGLYHFLCAAESSFLSGQAIYVDGGASAGLSDALISRLSQATTP